MMIIYAVDLFFIGYNEFFQSLSVRIDGILIL